MDETPRPYDPDQPLELDPDPVAQWLDWEEQANLVGFRTSTQPVEIDVVSVPREQLEVHILPAAPEAIISRFIQGDRVLFPRHPLNTDPTVAWFDAPVSERWTARFTSSRTLARIDPLLEPLAEVALVTEVLVVLAAGGESGFMVRDLRLFQDGHYYLPALSIPFVGRQIARACGEPFDAFWGCHFAEIVGRVKARLFVRYGLWFETPNPQNILVQLGASLRPTGMLVFRDVGDGECATDVELVRDGPWTRLVSDLRPETQGSFWAFGEAGDRSVDTATLERWYGLHDDAYFGELAEWFPELAPALSVSGYARLEHWNATLRTADAASAIALAFARRR